MKIPAFSLPVVFLGIFTLLSPVVAGAATETYTQSVTNAKSHADSPAGWVATDASMVKVSEAGSVGANSFELKYYGNAANNQLIVRTASKSTAYNGVQGTATAGNNYAIYGSKTSMNAWVTTGKEMTGFIDGQGLTASTVTKGIERGLGMNDAGTHDAIFEMAVTVGNSGNNPYLLRPVRNPNPTTYSTTAGDYGTSGAFPATAALAGIGAGASADNVFSNYKTSYTNWAGQAYSTSPFPWTQLGYTYYWGQAENPPTALTEVQGMSEFIMLGGTGNSDTSKTPSGTDESGKLIAVGIYATQSYIYTKNNGTILTDAAGSQYGNGFASFNVTGSCDSLWAGASFQTGTSLNAGTPNTITVGSGGSVSGGQGILVGSKNYTVTNSGTISASADTKKFNITGSENIALLFKGDAAAYIGAVKNILINSGAITGPGTNGTAVKALAGDTEITNTGTLSGNAYAIHFVSGTNVITNNAGGTISGPIKIDAGTTTITNNGIIDLGTAASDGGAYTQNAGGTLKLTANSAADFGKLTATSAAFALASEVSVTVGGYIANGASFTVVDVSGAGVTAPGTISSSSYAVGFTADGTADLILTAARASNAYAQASTNGNTDAAGAALDQAAANGPTGDMLTVLNALDSMGSAAEVSNAIETMVPDVSSGAAEGSRSLTAQGFTTVSNRLGGARNGGAASSGVSSGDMTDGVGVWMQGLGSHMKQGERKGVEGYSANLFGTTIGADKVIDKHFRAGLAGGYGWAGVKSKSAGSPSDDINSFQGTIYGSFDSLDLHKARQGGKKSYEAVRSQVENSWYVDGMFAFTQNNYDSRREIWLGTAKSVAKAEHYGQQYATNFEAGYKFVFEKTKHLEVTPFASLGYNYLYMNKYKEDGANALNLTVQGEGFHQLEQGLGTKLAYPMVAKQFGTFIPSAKAAWLYDYIGDRFETTASFAGGGGSFNTQGAKPAKNGMLFGAELAFLNKGNVTVTGNWDIELRDQFMSNTYYGTVRYDF
jgi:outer membrane autotransporter protein